MLAVLLLASIVGFLAVPAALADTQDEIDAAVSQFTGGDRVYQSETSGVALDATAVTSEIGTDPIYVAVLSPNATVEEASTAINRGLGKKATIIVLSGTSAYAGSTVFCENALADDVQAAVDKHEADITGAKDATALVTELVGAIRDAPTDNCDTGGVSADSDAGSVIPWVLGIGAVLLVIVGVVLLRLWRRHSAHLRGRDAEVRALVDRLGTEVEGLAESSTDLADQAIGDARERYESAEGILDTAETDDDYDAARRAALEGLVAVDTAQDLLGLPAGSPFPAIGPLEGEQLTESREVTVAGRTHRGYPRYTPGAPYFHTGGRGIPGGWYPEPFWETRLIGSFLGGADNGEDDRTAERS